MLSLLLTSHLLSAQVLASSPGLFSLSFGATALPVQLQGSAMDFRLEGAGAAGGPLEVAYRTLPRLVEPGLFVGLEARPYAGMVVALRASALFNSFTSNADKNGRVYGAAFHLGAGYGFGSGPLTLTPRLELGHVIGGYGITSFGRNGQPYVEVDGTRFYDDDVGVHVIDNAWQLGTALQGRYALSQRWSLQLEVGLLWTVGRQSYINIAGFSREGEDAPVEWKRQEFSDSNLELRVDGQPVRDPSGRELPYAFNGPSFTLGVAHHF